MPAVRESLLRHHLAYETRRFRVTSRAWSRWGMPHRTVPFCVIAYLNIQYFLYFGGNEQVLGWYELRGSKMVSMTWRMLGHSGLGCWPSCWPAPPYSRQSR